jgi:hypothetical protein
MSLHFIYKVVQRALGNSRQQAADLLSLHLLEDIPLPTAVPEDVLKEVLDAKDAKRYCGDNLDTASNVTGNTATERQNFQKTLKQKLACIRTDKTSDHEQQSKDKSEQKVEKTTDFIKEADKEYWHAPASESLFSSSHIKARCPQGQGFYTLVSRGSAQARQHSFTLTVIFVFH